MRALALVLAGAFVATPAAGSPRQEADQRALSQYLELPSEQVVVRRTTLLSTSLVLDRPASVLFQSDGTFAPASQGAAARIFVTADGRLASNFSTIGNPQKSAGRVKVWVSSPTNSHPSPRPPARAGVAVAAPPNMPSSAPSATITANRLMAITPSTPPHCGPVPGIPSSRRHAAVAITDLPAIPPVKGDVNTPFTVQAVRLTNVMQLMEGGGRGDSALIVG